MTKELNDSLDDLLSAPMSETPRQATAPEYKPLEQQFIENCAACGGSGQFRSYSGRTVGPCFKCKGAGKRTFKTSASDRASQRNQAANRKATRQQTDLDAFKVANPEIFAWIIANEATFSFAQSMLEAVTKFGDLTGNQRAACIRCMDRAAQAKEAAAARIANAPQVDAAGIDRLKLAFDTAIAYTAEKGLKLSPPNYN